MRTAQPAEAWILLAIRSLASTSIKAVMAALWLSIDVYSHIYSTYTVYNVQIKARPEMCETTICGHVKQSWKKEIT